MGANEYQTRLAEYLIALLAASVSPDDERQYRELLSVHERLRQRAQQLEIELGETIRIRNIADRLEQEVEPIRNLLGDERLKSFKNLAQRSARLAIHALKKAMRHAECAGQPFFRRLLLGLIKNRWYRTAASKVCEYFNQLSRLNAAKPLEQISSEHLTLVGELAVESESLWKMWLRLQPKRVSQANRRLLREYSSLLQMIVASNESGERLGSQVFKRYHNLFPQITNILSCWAVTSLSARGRLPFEAGFFELLIIDEASQCDIASALPLLYRAKGAVVIGDPKQLRHISALSPKQDRQLLAKHDLVEGKAAWAYSVNSLFDLASGLCRSDDIVALRDHHRSHADIIEFSNNHFYEGRLRVATNYQRLRFPSDKGPTVRWIDVHGKVLRPATGGAINQEEARAVVNEIERLVLRQQYVGAIGVVSPFRAQANLIRDLVFQHRELGARLTTMDFLADTVHRFQGDERDLMIFSPVVSTGTPDGALIFLRNNPNLFNVAITRARSALVVVGDCQAAINSGVEYLSRFAKYVGSVRARPIKEARQHEKFGPNYPPVLRPELVSDWEKVLYRALYAAGLGSIPQYDVEKYTLDLALFNGERKLDIEVDGERYHRNWDGELCRRDQIRNQRLIELGWDVMRFWVYQVRDDLANSIHRVRQWHDEMTTVTPDSETAATYGSDIAIPEKGGLISRPNIATTQLETAREVPKQNTGYRLNVGRCWQCGAPAIPGENTCWNCSG